MKPIKVAVSAKVEHAPKLAAIQIEGIHISSRWVHIAAKQQSRQTPVEHWQQENFDDIVMADAMMFYLEPGDKLKGALGEAFYAAAYGKKVWIAGDGHGVEFQPAPDAPLIRLPHRDIWPWCAFTQAFRVVLSKEQAFAEMKRVLQPGRILDSEGKEVAPASWAGLQVVK